MLIINGKIMARVVVTKNYNEIIDAPGVCPVSAFKKGPNSELVIDPNICIDCGVCQSVAPEGAIMADDEAPADAVKYNAEHSEEWSEA